MKKWEVKKTASKGYAIGPAYVVKKQEVTVDTASISAEQVDAEISRFEAAVEKAQADLAELAQDNAIFAGHFALAGDIAIHDGVVGKIKDELMNAEAALMQVKDEYVVIFESMDDEYMRERASDMKDVSKRLLFALKGIDDNPFAAMKEKSVIVAQDLTPSDTAKMNMDLVLGFATEEGGVTSHVSIIAKKYGDSLSGRGWPHAGRCGDRHDHDSGRGKGRDFPGADETMVALYKEKAEKFEAFQKELEELSTLPSETKDGHGFMLCANVGNIEDIKYATQFQIEGVGLFRSEFLYMENDHFPTEEEQFEAYKEAAQLLGGKELTIRTLDIGGDKELDYYEFPKEENPFLGYRDALSQSIRPISSRRSSRAILRASAFGYIRIMYL